MDNRSHKSSTSVYDNVFISNTSRYFIGHLIFPALFFFLFPRTVQRKRREIRGVNLLTPLMAVEKQRWKKIVAAESHTTTQYFVPLLVADRVVRRGQRFNISMRYTCMHASSTRNRIKKAKLLLYFRNCSMSLCNLDTRIYEIVFSFSFLFFPPSQCIP